MTSSSQTVSPLKINRIKSQGNAWNFIRFVTFNLVVFTLAALASVPGAYSTHDAIIKCIVLLSGVILFYCVIFVGNTAPHLLSPAISLAALVVAVLFLLIHDWHAQPADYGFINWLANLWSAVRPNELVTGPQAYARGPTLGGVFGQNFVGGVLASFSPFVLLWAWEKQGQGKYAGLAWWAPALCGMVIALTLLLTSSRAAFLSIAGAAALWLMWRGSGLLPASIRRWRLPGLAVLLAGGLILGALALTRSDAIAALFDRTPGFPSATSRELLARNALYLVADFPLIGGGLRSFAGLYSTYMQVIPYFLFGYSHNLYLDVAIEQSLLGLLALVAILASSVFVSLRAGDGGAAHPAGRLGQAAFVGLAILILHGLFDDAFYGEYGTPFLFVLPAVAFSAARQVQQAGPLLARERPRSTRALPRPWLVGALMFALVAAVFGRSFVSILFSNLGSVDMARSQLAGFPTNAWGPQLTSTELDQAESLFRRAVLWNPENRTANHRLGLIAMMRWDFQTACSYLQKAYEIDPGHRGVVKNLGYCLIWTQQYQFAVQYLNRIPEAQSELDAYAQWWPTLGRPDLVENARMMQALLTNEGEP